VSRVRIAVAALTISGAGLVGIALHEGYTDQAVIPIHGDRPTVGFGSTTRPDGTPVRMGDRTTPPQALRKALADIEGQFESPLRQCIKVPLHQHEWDFAVSMSYNIGASAFCRSTIVRRWNSGDYAGGCEAVMMWKYAAGKDCSVRANNCYGLIVRREAERRQCLGLG
jgi:lysozyme